jgi:hypothetical protein
MTKWELIETVPKDGKPVLLLSPDGDVGLGIVETVDYGFGGGPSVHGRTAAWAGQRPYETRPSIWMGGHNPMEATHWMPLPSPPESV